MANFTDEEMELIAYYDKGKRKQDLIWSLKDMRKLLDQQETRLRRLSAVVLTKLETMGEDEYRQLNLLPYIDHLKEADVV